MFQVKPDLRLQIIKREPEEDGVIKLRKWLASAQKPEAAVLLQRLTSNNLLETLESCPNLTAGNKKRLRDQLKAFESKGGL